MLIRKVNHRVGHISVNTRPHWLHWGDSETGTILSHAQNAVRWLNFPVSVATTSMACLCTTNSNTVTIKTVNKDYATVLSYNKEHSIKFSGILVSILGSHSFSCCGQ